MGALSFGHLATAFVPSGPMGTKISNKYKVQVRQQYAAGLIGKDELQAMENDSYHSVGTCTFYGTANTNQLVFEAMGLMLPGSAFVPVNSKLREKLTVLCAKQMLKIQSSGNDFRPLAKVLDEKSLVNGIVALLASGGSTNHTIHLIAVARAAGFILTWQDFSQLSEAVPLLTRIYPNGPADINDFHQAGGVPLLMQLLAERGLIHLDATPIYGNMQDYCKIPTLENDEIVYKSIEDSLNPDVIASRGQYFSPQGGLKMVSGNLGTGVIKVSAVEKTYQKLTALALVFEDQNEVVRAYQNGQLKRDAVIVVRNSGPAARGMPELHKLMPILGNVMEEGYRVMLVTDGPLSGASGKVPSIIHMSPESVKGGPLAFIETGDMVEIDVEKGTIHCLADLSQRSAYQPDLSAAYYHSGRELFALFRKNVSSAQEGATVLF
ncbi:dihydroxy-acid dehydratase [[Actinobacillus] rossii]|uniref:Dihydroxy-acid dehydratase n=1 Tax=[Actinobacillus] rossii TaxID=123820 RepID=A0A380U0E6_9PAST|nr:dihydroxy-acid dehydratase [[Actinobacillus] rossii]